MIDEFGVPMNGAEMSMLPPGAAKPHLKVMAESGLEMHFWQVAASIGIGLISGRQKAKAAGKQAKKHNEAVERQHEYNLKAYDMKKDQLRSEHAFRVEETTLKRKNEDNAANYRDAVASQNYARQLMIRNREQASLEAQFERSNKLYAAKTSYNQQAAALAEHNENRKLDEIHTEAAFDAQEQRLKNLEQEGKIRALGQSGVSVGKTHQSAAANFGYQIAMLNEGLESAALNHEAALQEIKNDKFSADLAAWAEKMLDPGELPMPLVPIPSPRTIYQDPEPLQEFHFGPPPVKGATQSVNAAKSAAWGSAIPSILSGGIDMYNTGKKHDWF